MFRTLASEAGVAPPRRVQVADDTLSADAAYRLACEGTALLWRGDFQNARQLLQAMARRVERKPRKTPAVSRSPSENFICSAWPRRNEHVRSACC